MGIWENSRLLQNQKIVSVRLKNKDIMSQKKGSAAHRFLVGL